MEYSLIPGTNELVKSNHGGAGTQLFRQHGYHIQHPRWRDYHNGLRTGGLQFFEALAGILTKVFPLGPHVSKPTAEVQAASTANTNLPSVFNIAHADDGFTGGNHDDNHDGPNKAIKLKAFWELLKHVEHEAHRERDPKYRYRHDLELLQQERQINGIRPVFITQYALPQSDQQYNPQQYTAPLLPVASDTIFGIQKKIAFGLLAVVAIVLYFKFRH